MGRRVTRKPKHEALYKHARKVYTRDARAMVEWVSNNHNEVWHRYRAWRVFYVDAFEWCRRTAKDTRYDTDTVAKVLAATSPLKSWGQNKAITKRVIEGAPVMTQPLTTNRKLLVDKILLDPTMPFPESGVKTWNFYHNIVNPWGRDHVTIDRHMIRPVLNRVSCSRLEYDAIADAVKSVASNFVMAPPTMQAALWSWYRTDGGVKEDRL